MQPKKSTPDIFDQWATAAPSATPAPVLASEDNNAAEAAPPSVPATPVALRRAVQELLKHGLLEETTKPLLFRQIAGDTARINAQLEPLDLEVRVDDVRGLAFVAIPLDYHGDGEDDDEWTHPLLRRQRLTLEQSLLLAILRREFLQREQEGGIGVPVQLPIDRLLAQIEIYLGTTGSEMQERKRLATLLEALRGQGVVSEVDDQESITIRPMIVHLANPQNLQALLQHLRSLATGGNAPSSPSPESAE